MQVLFLGRAPRTKETLPDFLKCRQVTRPPLVFLGLTGSQRTLGFWGVTKELWEIGVETYDASKGENFQMRAALLWTINDFPAYGMMSGWSTKGYMACPTCNKDICSHGLWSKICYMGHRRFLPSNHSW